MCELFPPAVAGGFFFAHTLQRGCMNTYKKRVCFAPEIKAAYAAYRSPLRRIWRRRAALRLALVSKDSGAGHDLRVAIWGGGQAD